MNTSPSRTPRWAGRLGSSVILLAVLSFAVGLTLAWGPREPRRVAATVFAAAVAGVGSIAGRQASPRTGASPASAVGGGLMAMTLRIAPPLAGLAWLSTGGGELRQAGADSLLVIFYLALLATAIFLDIMGSRTGPPPTRQTTGSAPPRPPGV